MRRQRVIGLLVGTAFGFLLAWADVTNPMVIHDMLRLREGDVFLIMGSAILVAAIGAHLLRAFGASAWATREPIGWSLAHPERHHVVGSVLFGAGWSIACTCPGPLAAMIGEGRIGALFVAVGLVAGIAAQGARSRTRPVPSACSETATAGL